VSLLAGQESNSLDPSPQQSKNLYESASNSARVTWLKHSSLPYF